jgi:hypothetical protein
MKRIGAVLVIGLGSLSLIGCTGADETQVEVEPGHVQFNHRCAVVDLTNEQSAVLEAKIVAEVGPEPEAAKPPGSITIPVWFHVINKGEGIENGDMPDEMIEDQLQVLIDSFGGRTGGAATTYTFELAGIERTTNARWYTMGPGSSAEREAKAALRKGDAKTLNVYLASPGGGLLGWATFPTSYKDRPTDDGVVILNQSMPGGNAEPYHLGDTLVHEVGHWFGLYHTFQGGCVPMGDWVKDTPRVRTPNFGCPARRSVDSCPTPDNEGGPNVKRYDLVENFMDYTDDDCMDSFTPRQSLRMDWQWKYRKNG